jgi:DNA-binding transcriptional LysR family regulator
MELRQLRHFVALAQTGSVTGAARREVIVQSGLSNSIQALERELGVDLYLRGTRPVRLTAAGQALVKPAKRALDAAAAAERAVHDTRDVLIGRLRLGVTTAAQHVVPFAGYLGDFLSRHPGVDSRLHVAAAPGMLAMVEGGDLDCVIAPVQMKSGRLRYTPLGRESLTLVCRYDHPLAGRAGVLIDDLEGHRFIDVPPEWTARLLTDAAFAKARRSRRTVAEVNDWDLFVELVASGVGVGFVPSGLPNPLMAGRAGVLRRVPVTGVHLDRQMFLILPPAAETSPVAVAFAADITADRRSRIGADPP